MLKISILPQQSHTVLPQLISLCKPNAIFLLDGNFGVGKTYLVQKLLEHWQIYDTNSPSYSLCNLYALPNTIWKDPNKKTNTLMHMAHIDVYRTACIEELFGFGLDMLPRNSAAYFFEWSQQYSTDQWETIIPQLLGLNSYRNSAESVPISWVHCKFL
jgi:tRNA A37 threonylcarbamoyladenosine biosynthesis protein TsaE